MTSSRNISIAAHIIPESGLTLQTPLWQQALSDAFTRPKALLDYLGIEQDSIPVEFSSEFSMRVPRGFADLMRRGDPGDPLLRQVLPLQNESVHVQGFSRNPVGDLEAHAVTGLLHKYHGRALLITTGACAIHCRYCFRRHYPYENGSATPRQWEALLAYLREHPTINEVILSGGDPLMLGDEKLGRWMQQLSEIPHLQRLRLHSRLPVVLPERITPELLTHLRKNPLQSVLVIHTNHPRELSGRVTGKLKALQMAGVLLLNQSVLLRGVNDQTAVLVELSERLFEAGVMPYYLHLLDRVEGAAHFEVEQARIHTLYSGLLSRLPGYMVPKLVRETAGDASKRPEGFDLSEQKPHWIT
ncbi:MAG: EF-P beta-lysylation protein EpmB [Gammaproteobacteria bacterium (ex Lamellibrachia satsuma)]|nr:MAG: EF-P beta-lysylation protein EpmB [Gammaproteobacteria bacterium (ex Lamellibrachia satsuma)]